MFAPTLFIGAMLGGAVGSFEKIFFPHLTGSIGSYALVGMGVLFAAFLRVPLTSVFMVLEVSGNYSIILPVILANTIAYLISRSLQPVPIFELLTNQDGLYLPSMEEEREEHELRLEDAIEPVKYPVIVGSDTLAQIRSSNKMQDLLDSPYTLVQCSNGWYAARKDEMARLIGFFGRLLCARSAAIDSRMCREGAHAGRLSGSAARERAVTLPTLASLARLESRSARCSGGRCFT